MYRSTQMLLCNSFTMKILSEVLLYTLAGVLGAMVKKIDYLS
jgi:hypothetical protein